MNKAISIVVTGPECTGKSTLTKALAKHFGEVCLDEFARDYIGGLTRPYTYADLVTIAEHQAAALKNELSKAERVVFCDTHLEITLIWFMWVYRTCPDWVYHSLRVQPASLYLLCNTDLTWTPDAVRENGGETRQMLYYEYKHLLDQYQLPYAIISGEGEHRLQNALEAIEKYHPYLTPTK